MKASRITKLILTISLIFCSVMVYADLFTKGTGPAPDPAEDATITAAIQKSIAESGLAAFKVDVVVQNGVVTLSGTLDTEEQAKKIVDIAGLTEGVKDIYINNLTVQTPPLDLWNTLREEVVKASIVREKIFNVKKIDDLPITVTVRNRMVYLSGMVDSQSQMEQVIKLLQHMQSVQGIIPSMSIKSGGTAYSP